jgi:NADPH:quinone reductase-like Zn-dependent oxidoreductase
MKAAIHKRYGPPDVVNVADVPEPMPKEDEILVKIFAATVNRTDSGFRSAEYFISRFWSGLFSPKYQTLGCEFAGEVKSMGSAVIGFKPGDKVFGYDDVRFGAHAEYKIISQKDAIILMPEGLSFEECAPLTEGAHYALNTIRAAKVKTGDQVLVYGATGAIGSAAVQLLKHFGAEVTAVCDTARITLVKSLGADRVIDYTAEDYVSSNLTFDFVFDAVGKTSFPHCKPVLKKNGIYISTELGKYGQNIWFALLAPLSKGKKVLFPIPKISVQDLELLKTLALQGKFKPVIDRSFRLDQIVEAYRYVETGHKTGNVLLIP